ncbi:uncharacterized protein LOC135705796 [Ochlerotatus camptorhynchus]|uniref:uncharacterized protein LOC135705796 n=1 Tax=Ochlerotatus camptorhynchus TaxID=644619 RepID=UPI0031D41157
MDINQLPLEVLQEILSYLSYDELKVASLVCHRWNQASGTFIVRNGQLSIHEQVVKNLEMVRNSTRNYQSILIYRISKWEQLQAVVSECMQKFPNVRKLYLAGVLQDYLDRFYRAYRRWMERLEFLQVSLDDRFENLFVCEPEDYILTLPNLKQLYWKECLYGHGEKTVTIDAPGLEFVHIDDSLDASAVLRIPHCERLKYIRCMFYTKHFDDIFVGDFGNVETLILNIVHDKCNVSCLSKMHQLRYLSLHFGNAMNYLQEVEAMPNSKLLKVLIIRSDSRSLDKCTLNLEKIIGKFENLETLDLFGINLTANNEIQADQLVFLKLREVTFSKNSILNAPKLKTLSLELDMLNYLQLRENKHLFELYVDLQVSIYNDSFEQIICTFLQEHKHIKNLTLGRVSSGEVLVQDDFIYDRIVESVEHLELHRFDVPINFFRLLAGWKSLKSLKLVACTINCSGMWNDVVRLPGVERIIVDCVQLRGTSRTDFPILLVNGANQEVVTKWNDSTLFFSTNKLIHKEYKFRQFSCPEIDPMF